MKKRIFRSALLIFIVLSMLISLCSCKKLPELDNDLRDRFINLIEDSKELNTIFFGAGLPVYYKDNEYSERLGVYYNDEMLGYYRVNENSSYITIDAIKEAAEKVYSKEYLSALYETAFDGVMTGNDSAYLRFYDDGEWLYQNILANDFEICERIYDYSTMKIVKPSSDSYINITIESYTLKNAERIEITLSFVYENGSWFLDCPTY
ncbi:MAG: hypothetical protein J6Q69_02365 [Clostridia bacterium]|nr:hypothetical protein [Clostridia bacterium]